MTDDAKGLVRAAAAVAIGIALVLAGIAIGANLLPKVVKVEQRVVGRAPAITSDGGILSRLPDLVQTACPAVVALTGGSAADKPLPVRRKEGDGPTLGAAAALVSTEPRIGFFISPDGFLLTPSANLPDSGDITAELNDGRELPARWIRSDALSGLALLKVDLTDVAYLEFAQQTFPRVGDAGAVIASPQGRGCSARLAVIGVDFLAEEPGTEAYVRTDPVAKPDLAGAPLIGLDGRVIAITETSPHSGAAMPAEVAGRVAASLLRNETLPEEVAGLLVDDASPQLAARLGAGRQQGAAILLVAPGSPAGRSGLRAGDVIVSAGGVPVSRASELGRAIDDQKGAMSIQLLRQGTILKFELLLRRKGATK